MTEPHVSLADIRAARDRIAGRIRLTPVERSSSLSDILGIPVHLKLEHQQATGSFKLRGATNAVLQLSDAQRAAGIIGVSTGNHGRGLARAAATEGIRCRIAMSTLVPSNKVEAIRAEGAETLIEGRSQDEAQIVADRLAAEGATMLPPFDHPHVIAGQGTLGLELVEQVPQMATLLVPLSGGGLFAGVARAVKALRPETRIIGVSMERGPAMKESLDAGHPVDVEELPTLADSLGGGIGLDNRHTFPMVRDLIDDVILLSEAEIAAGIRHLYHHERQIVEGGGSVGVGAILAGKVTSAGPVAIVVSGGNIDMTLHRRIVSGEDVDPMQEPPHA